VSDVEVSTRVQADPQVLYGLVSDVPRMGEWSPETRSCRWLDPPGTAGPAVGARFRGTNRHGLRWWTTTSTVTAAEPGVRFAFDVSFGPADISSWAYELAPDGDGCVVTESWSDRRAGWMRLASVPAMGVVDRAAHNRRTMLATLDALRVAAERRT
jgi:hypothetical protein